MADSPFPADFDPSGGIAGIYNAFEPSETAREEFYVQLEAVRGGWDILRELGKRIERSQHPTHQLYSGHRGVGKSTELLRLKKRLEAHKFSVVYFAADQADFEPEDVSYAYVLLACSRNLVRAIKLAEGRNPILQWLSSRWGEFKELAQTPMTFDSLSV
ncbi:MAG: ATP-binding protein, partial [Cyanophyceae cyanobacterium]